MPQPENQLFSFDICFFNHSIKRISEQIIIFYRSHIQNNIRMDSLSKYHFEISFTIKTIEIS